MVQSAKVYKVISDDLRVGLLPNHTNTISAQVTVHGCIKTHKPKRGSGEKKKSHSHPLGLLQLGFIPTKTIVKFYDNTTRFHYTYFQQVANEQTSFQLLFKMTMARSGLSMRS